MTKDKDMVNWKELTEADRKSYQAGHNASMKRHKEAIVAKDVEILALKKDAERYRVASEHLILSGGTTKFGWPIAPATKAEWDRYLDATIAKAVKPKQEQEK
jgi:hypothetical protein